MIRVVKRWSSTLLKPQLDINHIIHNAAKYETAIIERKLSNDLLSNLQFILANRSVQANITANINKLKKQRKELAKHHPVNKEESKSIKAQLKPLEKELKELEDQIYLKGESLPNLIDESVPIENKPAIVQFLNCTSESNAIEELPPTEVDHKSIMESFNIVDFTTASRVSGSSWYYLIGDGALLEQALIQFGLKKAREHGYKLVIPPTIVKSDVINACGFKPNDQNNEKQIYQLQDENNKCLTGTSEISLGALYSSKIFKSGAKFPIKLVGVSRCYRAEAGSSGKETKGLYRVHEFTKLELFHFTKRLNAKQELEDLVKLQSEIVKELELKAKVLNMPSSDLGSPAMKKYDIEAWMPGKQAWGELTSCSNCGDYQSRRLGIRYNLSNEEITSKKKTIGHVATLNGTAMAVPRMIVAIIEQNYDPINKRIRVPEVLQSFMEKEYIYPN